MNAIEISESALVALAERQIAATLTPHVVRTIARAIIRKQIGVISVDAAARWLGFKSPESCRRVLTRSNVPRVKLCARQLGYRLEDLKAYRDARVVMGRRRQTPKLKLVA